jgi:hypothetical protein
MIAMQGLLVSGGTQGSLVTGFLEEQQVSFSRGVLPSLVESKDSRRAMLELGGEDYFGSIDEEERSFPSRIRCCHANRPQHRLELVKPALAAGVELFLEASCLEDLSVGAFGLAVASLVRHGGVANLRAEAGAV